MARPIGDVIPEVLERARRISIIGELVASFEDKEDAKEVVMRLYQAEVITDRTAELLIETFGLEAA